MTEWLRSWFLGVVQGLTEFLPISSDGHLALVQILTSKPGEAATESGADFVFFDVMLHVGTAVAIVIFYRKTIWTHLRAIFDKSAEHRDEERRRVFRIAWLAFVATLPLIPLKLFLMDWMESLFESLTAVGVGFLITAVVLVLTLRLTGGTKGPRETTWVDALLIGIAQAFAPLPGVSRSGMTVAAALLRGFDRGWAVAFSLLIALPAIGGAALSKALDLRGASISGERMMQIISATLIAGVVGYFAIGWLVGVVRSNRLWWFSVYLFALSALILLYLVPRERSTSERHAPSPALDSSATGRADRARDRVAWHAPGQVTHLDSAECHRARSGARGLEWERIPAPTRADLGLG